MEAYGKVLEYKDYSDVYFLLEDLVYKLDKENLLYFLNQAEIYNKQKENIYKVLDFLNVILYNTKDIKKINCIEIVEDTKRRLNLNSNFDMTIDNLLIKIWEEVNEKYSRS